jgi:hypothetical protein
MNGRSRWWHQTAQFDRGRMKTGADGIVDRVFAAVLAVAGRLLPQAGVESGKVERFGRGRPSCWACSKKYCHLNLKFSRLSSLIDRQPISFMSRSISLWRF